MGEALFGVFRPREDDGAYRESICGTWHMPIGTLLIFSLLANNVWGWGALCTCSARANVLALLPFPASTGETVGTADTKLTGHMYAIPAYILLWLPFL